MYMTENKCDCGEESTKGCHGVKEGEIFSIYYCDLCYTNRDFLTKGKKDETANAIQKD
jgi:hypothetical protein